MGMRRWTYKAFVWASQFGGLFYTENKFRNHWSYHNGFSNLCLYLYDSIQQTLICTYDMPGLCWEYKDEKILTLNHVHTRPQGSSVQIHIRRDAGKKNV